MKIVKRVNSVKYPIYIRFTNGRKLIIPKQSKFENEFLRKHGCSLMAEYIALQFVGIRKYPIHLLSWHKKNTPGEIFSKVTLRGVTTGLEKIGKKDIFVQYYKTVTAERIEKALKKGYLVIMEQKKPIHTIVLVRDQSDTFMLSHGDCKKVNVEKIAATATTNARYRGMIVVQDRRKTK